MPKSHASFQVLITKTLKFLNPLNRKYISPISMRKYISKKYDFEFLKVSNYYFRKALQNMLEKSILLKHQSKYMFRLKPGSSSTKKKVQKHKKSQPAPILKKKITKKVKNIPILKKKSSKSSNKSKTLTKSNSLKKANSLPISNSKLLVKSKSKQLAENPKNNSKKTFPIWQYYDLHNPEVSVQSPDGWYDYNKKASDIVEEEWQKYMANRNFCDVRSVKSGHFEYSVDFMGWTQTNVTHVNHKVRKIRRLDDKGEVTINPYQGN